MSASTAQTFYWAFVTLQGIGLSILLYRYTGESVVRVFFITAAAFAGLSLYGYTTKRSLSAIGSFLMMGLIGLVIAMVVNIFLCHEADARLPHRVRHDAVVAEPGLVGPAAGAGREGGEVLWVVQVAPTIGLRCRSTLLGGSVAPGRTQRAMWVGTSKLPRARVHRNIPCSQHFFRSIPRKAAVPTELRCPIDR